MLKSIRNKFFDFFEKKGHLNLGTFPIIPQNDPTLLFVNAGMAPMKQYFLNEDTPPSTRITTSQYCCRVGGKHNDLADVGYSARHYTFFEMLGNFSFGDYYKKEAIAFAWEFLVDILKLDKNRLYITVHTKDSETASIWRDIIDEKRIFFLEENIWSMGKIGPFGYCTEIFYDLIPSENIDLSDDVRFLEIWNLVFMQYYSDGENTTSLDKLCVDTGMGLERIVSVLENQLDTYNIAFFKDCLKYLNKTVHTVDTKIFLDHLRTVSFMLSHNVMPGATGRGYIIRRLIRRCYKAFCSFEGLQFSDTVRNILAFWGPQYNTSFDVDVICRVLEAEISAFNSVFVSGMKMFEEILRTKNTISAEDMFLLHDTYGFTSDIVVDLIKERNINCNYDDFVKLMEQSKGKSRAAKTEVLPFPATEFLDQKNLDCQIDCEIIGVHEDCIILDKSPFYAESGGQVGDIGIIIDSANNEFEIIDTKKVGGVFLHKYDETSLNYIPKTGNASAKINFSYRANVMAHHSSSHLVFAAICSLFGADIKQMGSYVGFKKFRLDFDYNKDISREEMMKLENIVNSWIRENIPLTIQYLPYQEAVKSGAKAFFEYGNTVRVVSWGDRSKELCGGTHVERTGDIGFFKILKIGLISSGIKRLEACASQAALEYCQKLWSTLKDVAIMLKVEEEQVLNKVKKICSNIGKESSLIVKRPIQGLRFGYIVTEDANVKFEPEKIMNEQDVNLLLFIVDANNGKISLKLASCDPKVNCKEVLQGLGKFIDAKGCGGRADFAQTGGRKIGELNFLIDKIVESISSFD